MVFNSMSDRDPSYSGKNDNGRDLDKSCILEGKIWSWIEIGKGWGWGRHRKEKAAEREEGKGEIVGQNHVQVKWKKKSKGTS